MLSSSRHTTAARDWSSDVCSSDLYSVLANCQAGTFATPGGTSAGSKTVAAGSVPNSDDVTLAAGTYYFRVFYGGDLKNDPASSACADEVVTVTNAPSISTTLSATSGSAPLTMHDSATLSGATADASGTAKYAYYSVLANCQAGTFATPGGTSAG